MAFAATLRSAYCVLRYAARGSEHTPSHFFAQSGSSLRAARSRPLFAVAGMLMMSTGPDDNDIQLADPAAEALSTESTILTLPVDHIALCWKAV